MQADLSPKEKLLALSVIETRGPVYGTHSLVWKAVHDDEAVPLEVRECEYTLHCGQCGKTRVRSLRLKSVPDPGEAAALQQLMESFRSSVGLDCAEEVLLDMVEEVHRR